MTQDREARARTRCIRTCVSVASSVVVAGLGGLAAGVWHQGPPLLRVLALAVAVVALVLAVRTTRRAVLAADYRGWVRGYDQSTQDARRRVFDPEGDTEDVFGIRSPTRYGR